MPGKAKASAPALSGGEGAIAGQPRESLALLGPVSPRGQGPTGRVGEAALPQQKPRALVLHPAAAVKGGFPAQSSFINKQQCLFDMF